MNKKTGTAGALKSPKAPRLVKEAAVGDSGQVSTATAAGRTIEPGSSLSWKAGNGTSGGSGSGASPAEPPRKVWISIELRDDAGKPVADEPYEIRVPGEELSRAGTLNRQGQARLEGVAEGECEVCFPKIDGREWSKVATRTSAD